MVALVGGGAGVGRVWVGWVSPSGDFFLKLRALANYFLKKAAASLGPA